MNHSEHDRRLAEFEKHYQVDVRDDSVWCLCVLAGRPKCKERCPYYGAWVDHPAFGTAHGTRKKVLAVTQPYVLTAEDMERLARIPRELGLKVFVWGDGFGWHNPGNVMTVVVETPEHELAREPWRKSA